MADQYKNDIQNMNNMGNGSDTQNASVNQDHSMDDKPSYEGFTLRLALVDALPVLFFTVAIVVIALGYHRIPFLIGGGLCIVAGTLKVLWKVILAVAKKDIHWMNKQMMYTMLIGFIVMVISTTFDLKNIDCVGLLHNIIRIPSIIFFGLGIVMMVIMIILAKKLDKTVAKNNWIEQCVNLVGQGMIMLGVISCAFFAYLDNYYQNVNADALTSTDTVTVSTTETGYFFDGPGTKQALIFYPGAKIEDAAYGELMKDIAEGGMDCYLIHMPGNMAVFGINRADKLLGTDTYYEYDEWYIGGHSLGGAMAARYAAKHADQLKGLLLLAAYSDRDLSNTDLSVLCLYGTNDGILNLDTVDKYRENENSDNYEESLIIGGNHAQFGTYGAQEGDGEATIYCYDQIVTTANYVLRHWVTEDSSTEEQTEDTSTEKTTEATSTEETTEATSTEEKTEATSTEQTEDTGTEEQTEDTSTEQ